MKEKGNSTNIPRVTIIYKANEVGRRDGSARETEYPDRERGIEDLEGQGSMGVTTL